MATTTVVTNKVIYSDINAEVQVDSPYELSYNEEAVMRSLDNIWGTKKFTRPFNRAFGCRLGSLLFDPINELTARSIGREMREAAAMWETRIRNLSIVAIPDYAEQQYYVEVTFDLPELGKTNIAYTFNLNKQG